MIWTWFNIHLLIVYHQNKHDQWKFPIKSRYGKFQAARRQILALLARLTVFSRSMIRVLPASMARQAALTEAMVWMVRGPMTGTSKRLSWAGLEVLTTTAP